MFVDLVVWAVINRILGGRNDDSDFEQSIEESTSKGSKASSLSTIRLKLMSVAMGA